MMTAVILIGGFGLRLRPLTLTTPKPMLRLLSKPFLHYQLRWLKRQGVEHVVLCTAYRPEIFKKTFGNGKKLGLKIDYVHEPKPLGTGGAIKNAERFISGTTVVCNGDILMDLDLGALVRHHLNKKAEMTLSLQRVPDPSAYGLVEVDSESRVLSFVEKPSPELITTDTVNAGLYVFEPSVWRRIPKNKVVSVERDVFPECLESGRSIFALTQKGYWMDIGTPTKYMQAQFDLLNGLIQTDEVATDFETVGQTRVWIGKGTRIHPTAVLEGPVVIGDGCRIGKGVAVSRSVLMNGTTIGENSVLKDCLIGERSVIGQSCELRAGTVIGPRSVLMDYSRV